MRIPKCAALPAALFALALLPAAPAFSAEIGISGMNIGMTPDQIEKAALDINPDWRWSGFTKWELPSGEEYIKFGKWGHPNIETRSREDIDVMFSGLGSGNGMVALHRTILFGEDLSKVPLGKAVADGLLERLGEPSQISEDGGSYRITWQFDAQGNKTDAYKYDGNCIISSDLVGLRMDPNCGLYVTAGISSDNLGRAGRLDFQMIDHRRAIDAAPLDEAYAAKSLETAKAKSALSTISAPKF
ncbi:hypothetical protein [Rhizobium sp. 21-4511-3d]